MYSSYPAPNFFRIDFKVAWATFKYLVRTSNNPEQYLTSEFQEIRELAKKRLVELKEKKNEQ